jgi:hypothetical protein
MLALAGGEAVRPVWVNELGGITFEIGAEGGRRPRRTMRGRKAPDRLRNWDPRLMAGASR